MGYDILIYALGSQVADLDSVPGVAEHAYSVIEPDRALRLRERVGEAGVIAVVGRRADRHRGRHRAGGDPPGVDG